MHKICCVVEGTINRLKNQELCFCNPLSLHRQEWIQAISIRRKKRKTGILTLNMPNLCVQEAFWFVIKSINILLKVCFCWQKCFFCRLDIEEASRLIIKWFYPWFYLLDSSFERTSLWRKLLINLREVCAHFTRTIPVAHSNGHVHCIESRIRLNSRVGTALWKTYKNNFIILQVYAGHNTFHEHKKCYVYS